LKPILTPTEREIMQPQANKRTGFDLRSHAGRQYATAKFESPLPHFSLFGLTELLGPVVGCCCIRPLPGVVVASRAAQRRPNLTQCGPSGERSARLLNSVGVLWRCVAPGTARPGPSSKRLLGQLPGRGWVRLPCTSAMSILNSTSDDIGADVTGHRRAKGLAVFQNASKNAFAAHFCSRFTTRVTAPPGPVGHRCEIRRSAVDSTTG
jgi:hypothetical protein